MLAIASVGRLGQAKGNGKLYNLLHPGSQQQHSHYPHQQPQLMARFAMESAGFLPLEIVIAT